MPETENQGSDSRITEGSGVWQRSGVGLGVQSGSVGVGVLYQLAVSPSMLYQGLSCSSSS
jgi:hypothetical protein